MADLVFNIAKGRAAELYNRVKSADPATSRLFVDVYAGSVTDAALKDCDTHADIVAAGLTALTSSGWTSKTITAADIAAMAPDDANDRMDLDIPDQTWTTVTVPTISLGAGQQNLKLVVDSGGWNINYIDIFHRPDAQVYLEFLLETPIDTVIEELRGIPAVKSVELAPPFSKIYGKRIIIMGGGAQVGQVAVGAISEADRHNIRGERISVDTIPLVGEKELAAAVRALVRLPRVRLLVLAGSLMGGDITRAVEEVRREGLRVISLNMAGTVPDAADLVVSDPVQAGVMAVMTVADTAKFDLLRQQKKRY